MARLKEGSKIDEFEKIHYITSGGFGNIYKALHAGNYVALKQLESPTRDPLDLSDFKREGKILEAISPSDYFPEFVKFWQEDPADDFSVFLAMEWIEGNTLHEEIQKNQKSGKPPDPKSWIDFFICCLEGLEYLHTPNPSKLAEWADPIIHRDIKPKNIKISPSKKAVILDVGAGRFLKRATGTVREQTTRVASGIYESPESMVLNKVYTISDIYSLGLTLYAFLINEEPMMELIFSSERLDPSYDFYDENPARFPMSHWNSKVDQALQHIIYKMCCIKRADRWQNAQEVIESLKDWGAGKSVVISSPAPVPTPSPRRITAPPTTTTPVAPVAPKVKPITSAPTAIYKICSSCGGLVTEKFCIFCGASWQGKTADKICKKCGHWMPQNYCVSCGELWR